MSIRTAFVFCLLSCTAAFGAGEPQWLKDARARESKSLAPAEIRSKDGWFNARTPGKLVNTIEKVDGSYSVELEIAEKSFVFCEIYPESVDLANALRVTFGNALEEFEAAQGRIEARALESTDAGAYGAVPYISLAWLYRVAAPDGTQLGGFRQFVMEKGGSAVYCALNELGFGHTFTAITRAFAETLETREPASAPQYVEISTASLSGSKVGIAVSTLELDSEGDTRARQMTAFLIASADGSIQTQDTSDVHWLRPDGTLINAANSEVSNGELSNSLVLNGEDGIWFVDGEIQGRPFETELPKGSRPGSWVAQARELRALLAEPNAVGREHSIGLWLAEYPDKLTAVKTKILARQGDRFFTARGEIGGVIADLTLDRASGMSSAAGIRLGPINLTLERVYVSGSF